MIAWFTEQPQAKTAKQAKANGRAFKKKLRTFETDNGIVRYDVEFRRRPYMSLTGNDLKNGDPIETTHIRTHEISDFLATWKPFGFELVSITPMDSENNAVSIEKKKAPVAPKAPVETGQGNTSLNK